MAASYDDTTKRQTADRMHVMAFAARFASPHMTPEALGAHLGQGDGRSDRLWRRRMITTAAPLPTP